MFLFALTASAATFDIVLDGTIIDGTINNQTTATPTVVTGQTVRTVLTVDDSVVANASGVFDYTAGSTLVMDIPVLGESLVLNPTYSVLAAVFSGSGFVVNQGVYGANLGFAFAEDYVVEPPVDFSNAPLFPFGAWALDEGGNGQLNTQPTFIGADSGNAYKAVNNPGGPDVDIAFRRVYVQETGFFENTIDAYYGSDVIDESFGFNRRPSTIDANLRTLDLELTDAGCFVDMGDSYAGSYLAGDRTGEGQLGDAVDLANTGGRTFAGTIGANSVNGIQNRQGKAVAADGPDLVAGYHQRTTGKRGFWYAVRVTGCTPSDLEPWFGSSLAAL